MRDNERKFFSSEDLTVSVAGRMLVDALTMEVERGELIAVLGQNGSGKTLTLHTLAGLRPAQQTRTREASCSTATARR